MPEDSFDSDHDSIVKDSSDWAGGGFCDFLEFPVLSAGAYVWKPENK
jgi:hypothetical protein